MFENSPRRLFCEALRVFFFALRNRGCAWSRRGTSPRPTRHAPGSFPERFSVGNTPRSAYQVEGARQWMVGGSRRSWGKKKQNLCPITHFRYRGTAPPATQHATIIYQPLQGRHRLSANSRQRLPFFDRVADGVPENGRAEAPRGSRLYDRLVDELLNNGKSSRSDPVSLDLPQALGRVCGGGPSETSKAFGDYQDQ